MPRQPIPIRPPKRKGSILRYVPLATREEDGCRSKVIQLAALLTEREGRPVTGPEAVRVALEEAIKRRVKT